MGIIYMLLSSASFTTMSALIKFIGPEIPVTQLVFLRCIIAAPVLLAIIIRQRRPLLVQARSVLLIRSAFGMTAMFCFFYALTHMPLADCAFIGRTQPLLIALLAPLVLGEKTPREAWLAIIAGLAGVALVMKPAMAWPAAAWIAFAAAVFSAGAHLMVRRLNRTDHPLVIVFNFTVVTAVVSSFAALPGFVQLSLLQWLSITGVALLASMGQFFMTTAYGKDRAPAIAAASYASILLSVFYGYVFWNEMPEPLAWAGGFLIILGGLLLLKMRYRMLEPAIELPRPR